MTKRDLFNLAVGKYECTDGVFDYTLSKTTDHTNKLRNYYFLRHKDSGNHVFITERQEEDVYDWTSEFKRKKLQFMISAGGFTIHSDNASTSLPGLRFKPRGSFKEFIKRTNKNQ